MSEWGAIALGWWASLTGHLSAGDWPTFAGSIFAGVAALSAIWTLNKQRVDAKSRSQFELRRQASQIAAWVVEEDTPRNGSAFGSGAIHTLACVSNPSGVPIFNLVLRIYAANELMSTRNVPLLPPTADPMKIDISRIVFEKNKVELEIEFIDGNGAAWMRNRRFALSSTDSKPFKILRPGTWIRH